MEALVITFNDEKIFFTGGGSGGHVIPAKTIITEIHQKESDIQILYIGGKKSIERKIIEEMNIKYFPISTGKLRRYFSVENAIDFFDLFLELFSRYLSYYPIEKIVLFFQRVDLLLFPLLLLQKFLELNQ